MIKKVNCCVMYWCTIIVYHIRIGTVNEFPSQLPKPVKKKPFDIWYVISIPQILKRNGFKMFQIYFIDTQKNMRSIYFNLQQRRKEKTWFFGVSERIMLPICAGILINHYKPCLKIKGCLWNKPWQDATESNTSAFFSWFIWWDPNLLGVQTSGGAIMQPRLGPSTSLATFGTDSWHLGGAGLGDCGDWCHTLVTWRFYGWKGGDFWEGFLRGEKFGRGFFSLSSKRFEIGLFVCLFVL